MSILGEYGAFKRGTYTDTFWEAGIYNTRDMSWTSNVYKYKVGLVSTYSSKRPFSVGGVGCGMLHRVSNNCSHILITVNVGLIVQQIYT